MVYLEYEHLISCVNHDVADVRAHAKDGGCLTSAEMGLGADER